MSNSQPKSQNQINFDRMVAFNKAIHAAYEIGNMELASEIHKAKCQSILDRGGKLAF